MSLLRRLIQPVRAPIGRTVHHYVTFFEDLIHAVKSELVAKVEGVDGRIDALERSVSTSHDSLTDQIALQAAAVRSLSAELERLRRLAEDLDAETPSRRADDLTINGQLANTGN